MLREEYFSSEYFDPEATLECGQTFRYRRTGEEFTVFSADRACTAKRQGARVRLAAEEKDFAYFVRNFELERDYAPVAEYASGCEIPAIRQAARFGRGIRILNQDPAEVIFSFLLSQNNNIPRIRATIERLCAALGEECRFGGERYFAFPTAEALAKRDAAFYVSLGCGYRAAYLEKTARLLASGGMADWKASDTPTLREKLLALPGIGPKVADCILLFGFRRTDAFPVDTWIERAYREYFGGSESREQIAQRLRARFGRYGGYIQQYLFYYEREGRKEHGIHHN